MNVALGGAHLLDEVDRGGARRLQMAMVWPRAAQQNDKKQLRQYIQNFAVQCTFQNSRWRFAYINNIEYFQV